jgi:hypothetical protein
MVKSQAHLAHSAFINQQLELNPPEESFVNTIDWGRIPQQWLKDNYPETTVEQHNSRPWAADNAQDSVTVYRFQDKSFIAFNRNGFYDID